MPFNSSQLKLNRTNAAALERVLFLSLPPSTQMQTNVIAVSGIPMKWQGKKLELNRERRNKFGCTIVWNEYLWVSNSRGSFSASFAFAFAWSHLPVDCKWLKVNKKREQFDFFVWLQSTLLNVTNAMPKSANTIIHHKRMEAKRSFSSKTQSKIPLHTREGGQIILSPANRSK